MPRPADRYITFVVRKELTPFRAGWAIGLATLFVTFVSGIVIRILDPADFGSLGLALWWAVQTVTTVGYGDVVPKHLSGRIVATILMVAGIGVLAVVTAVITAAFLETVRRLRDPGDDKVMQKLDELGSRLDGIESALRR